MQVSTAEQNLWTTLSLINWSAEHLTLKGFESARLTTELLLARVLQCTRIDLYAKFDRPLSGEELARFKTLFKRRLAHEPLQYILGETEFMGLKFNVDRRVLIPRPETEVLVEHVVELSKRTPVTGILEIGTGSGNIAVSLATFIDKCEIDAVDCSADALQVARGNLEHHHVEHKVNLVLCDVMQAQLSFPRERYDVIVSNPPYVSLDEFLLLPPEVREFEPQIATCDGNDGLTYFKALAGIGRKCLAPRGSVMAEFAYNQSDAVSSLFCSAGYTDIEIVPDYNKIPRVLKARRQ